MDSEKPILYDLLNSTFNKSTILQIENNYLFNLKGVTRWKCFSDYCLDDKSKPNDVMTFSIFPYVSDYFIVESIIMEIAKVDIKNTRTINKKYIEFLKHYPLINFSFILNERKKLFGDNGLERKNQLINEYERLKKMYENWITNEPEKEERYLYSIKKVNSCLNDIRKNKKLNIYIDMLLISFLGAYVSHIIINKINKLEIFGWFSDRDKIMDVENSFITDMFHNNLHTLIDKKEFQFATTHAKSTSEIFYNQFVKIPDYIAGTLADYNLQDNLVSKDKFNTILTEYMADNIYNNFVFEIYMEDNEYKCSKIDFFKK